MDKLDNTNKVENIDTVKVRFHRLKSMVSSVVPMYIYIDEELVATLKNDETIEANVKYGKHKIKIDMFGETEKELDFSEENKNVDIDLKTKMGMITSKVEIVSIRYDGKNKENALNINQDSVKNESNLNANTNDTKIQKDTHKLACISLAFSIIGLFFAGIVMGVIAVGLGYTARKHMKTKEGKGNKLITASIVIGYIDIIAVILGNLLRNIIL